MVEQPQDRKVELDRSSADNAGFSWVHTGFNIFKGLALMVLMVVNEKATQIGLSPVYGSIPASADPFQAYTALTSLIPTFFVAIALLSLTHFQLDWSRFLGPFAFSIPMVQYYLFRFSGFMGPVWGPAITRLLSCLPLDIVSAMVSTRLFKSMLRSRRFADLWSLVVLGLASTIEALRESLSSWLFTASVSLSRLGLQHVIATLHLTLFPSKYSLFCLLPILHTLFCNVHVPLPYQSSLLNSTLHTQGYFLVARQESVTGYISVLDNSRSGFRVMRCDHSLLGGEWLQHQSLHPSKLKAPIYSIFVMLEAVRLVEPDPLFDVPVKESGEEGKSALVIGSGVGTTPSAMIAHGIETTIVEIDPVVHDFATKYFNLPKNHTRVIQDVIVFAASKRNTTERYDYIIHDVFTGGAEPIPLFTFEFLEQLREMLKPDGVIAINYAGDLLLEPALRITSTIMRVFQRSCRLFRESPPPPSSSLFSPVEEGETDFTNLVIFCLNPYRYPAPPPQSSSNLQRIFSFREPTEADFLGSAARREYLLPEFEISFRDFRTRATSRRSSSSTAQLLLHEYNAHGMEKWQLRGARGHWSVMRSVLPDRVWELW